MPRNDLLALLDREAETLAAENNHSAAGLMRAAAAEIRGSASAGPMTIYLDTPMPPEAVERLGAFIREFNLRRL